MVSAVDLAGRGDASVGTSRGAQLSSARAAVHTVSNARAGVLRRQPRSGKVQALRIE